MIFIDDCFNSKGVLNSTVNALFQFFDTTLFWEEALDYPMHR